MGVSSFGIETLFLSLLVLIIFFRTSSSSSSSSCVDNINGNGSTTIIQQQGCLVADEYEDNSTSSVTADHLEDELMILMAHSSRMLLNPGGAFSGNTNPNNNAANCGRYDPYTHRCVPYANSAKKPPENCGGTYNVNRGCRK